MSLPNTVATEEETLIDVIERRRLRTHFQPIVSVATGRILAYEALTRGPEGSSLATPLALFAAANRCRRLAALEQACLACALERWARTGLDALLFLNISPDVLIDVPVFVETFVPLLDRVGLAPTQIVLEITEQSPGIDPQRMATSVEHYQSLGFSFALDDLGDGYAGLRLWSELTPSYVKLDRHFVSGIDGDHVKRRFVRSIIDIAHSLGGRVIAEGVERQAELDALLELGADYCQGWLFAHPDPQPRRVREALEARVAALRETSRDYATVMEIRRLCVELPALGSSIDVASAVERFTRMPEVNALAVVDEHGRPLGLLGRQQLMALLGKRFGFDLHGRQPISQVMQAQALCVEACEPLERVSRKVTGRDEASRDEDFIITDGGHYLGVGHVINLLQLVTEQQVQVARQANPLTQLPGNQPIRAALERYQHRARTFVACYLDLDHFKPFNDRFGYALGDQMILILARVLSEATGREDFLGHLGGDDFVLLLDGDARLHQRLGAIQSRFQRESSELLPTLERAAGGFHAKDRFDQWRFFPHTRLSIIALRTPPGAALESFGDLWSRFKTPAKRADNGRAVVTIKSFDDGLTPPPVVNDESLVSWLRDAQG
ncbi:bifunctional diguanylate cyclase/phosphodiesterase [Salinicola aestuarinus]|uniref:bifunctional diguanylate cyclase/phosphodiesterase n=1 Tax=Salinicola aestuarinus TaxID=1949082 RepID=UPI000DA1270F|nr:bifunctional diguanylate cyclase/phosphodiesterase [Salinicola aestuarinus]